MFSFFNKSKERIKLPVTTDIHCHVIPGIDDGSPDAKTSANLIEQMQQWGINRILATPHVTKITFENSLSTIQPAMGKLKAELAKRGNDIAIDHAAEYRIDELLAQNIAADTLMTYPGNYILIENSFMQEPWNIKDLVFDLQMKGLTPVLAHPERYAYYYKRKERLNELHEAGLLLQINVLSLAEAYGKAERKMAEYLMKENLVDFIGTDLHRQSHVEAINKYLESKNAHKDFDNLAGRLLNDKVFPLR